VVLAGGGTAGHTSPLIATAHELARQHPGIRITALGTERGLETTVVPAAGLPLELIPPVPLPRRPTTDLLRVPGRLRASIAAAARVLRDTKASAVLGFGGYVSTPAYLAARRLKLPIVVHEQNVLPGLANRLAARFTEHVYTSFAETELPHAAWIGLPMRRAITELDRDAERVSARLEFGLAPDRPVLLVSGGSQGAARINTAVEGARDDLLGSGIQILHVLGPKNAGAETAYTHPDNGAVYRPLAYVEKMERAYAAADLMLGRCGAGTVLETAVVGLPAVFVPYPHGNGEQRRNARLVVDAGAGLLVEDADCTSELVAARIPELVNQAGRLAGMSVALRGVARGDAASTLARRTLEVARAWA
jgi:UDP-N-acetylglucosamine--N-acetylmuramyl-(pentapeptide) pyrophosphoryl-undecaprenol N-acetylglucosamine transferase